MSEVIVFIPLTQGKVVVIDFEDFEKVRGRKWQNYKGRYAQGIVNGKSVFLHRFLMNAKKGEYVDHKDGNGLNCQRNNIRLCSNRQNSQGFRTKSKNAFSQFRGVYLHKPTNRWNATRWYSHITVNGKAVHLGFFESEEDAARAYDAAAKKYFGEFATPNFS